ncbi:MAG: hypothetical protein LN568_03860 [Rickettsia endosymbiont of Pseudomimeciton antennatum]|nr:hypothetical protein [Rickettsia endosymbiont of Pseudomimeciton antennatum]MCC8397871.1 hypothetical protein [Rickettsia endosymbiont of Labidopullus appendiculatus]
MNTTFFGNELDAVRDTRYNYILNFFYKVLVLTIFSDNIQINKIAIAKNV